MPLDNGRTSYGSGKGISQLSAAKTIWARQEMGLIHLDLRNVRFTHST